MHARSITLALGMLVFASGCGDEIGELTLATPDGMAFEQNVYPVMLRDCAFHACHGSRNRFLQIFGPGRGRMSVLLRPLDEFDPMEIEHSYQRALSMIDAADPEASLLLRKPLAVAAGGAGHEGTDEHGRDVYDNTLDPGFVALRAWATMVTTTTTEGAIPTLPGASGSMPPGPGPAPGAP